MNVIIRKIIHSNLAPAAIGPYSQAVLVNTTLYISGQLGLDPKSGDFVSGDVEAQTRRALQNMGEILKAAGATYNNVKPKKASKPKAKSLAKKKAVSPKKPKSPKKKASPTKKTPAKKTSPKKKASPKKKVAKK